MRKRWRLFHATDFHSLMHPCFTLCRILGMFPYKINNSVFETSKPHYILSIISVCVLCAFQLINIYRFNMFTKIINFENTIIFIEINCYGTLTSFVAIVTLVLSNSRMRLLQTIMEISSRLSPKSFQKLSRLIHFKDLFGFFYVIVNMFINFFIIDGMDTFYLISSMYPNLIVLQTDMLYMNCVCILKACFEEINNNLLRIHELIVNNGPHISMMFYYKQRNSFLIMNLKALKKQQVMISNTLQMLNMIFNLQLLATIVLIFFASILELYFNVVEWNDGLSINWNKAISIFLPSILYHIIKIALLVWACETVKNEIQETRFTIHDILNSTRDKQIKNEVVKVQFNLYIFLIKQCMLM